MFCSRPDNYFSARFLLFTGFLLLMLPDQIQSHSRGSSTFTKQNRNILEKVSNRLERGGFLCRLTLAGQLSDNIRKCRHLSNERPRPARTTFADVDGSQLGPEAFNVGPPSKGTICPGCDIHAKAINNSHHRADRSLGGADEVEFDDKSYCRQLCHLATRKKTLKATALNSCINEFCIDKMDDRINTAARDVLSGSGVKRWGNRVGRWSNNKEIKRWGNRVCLEAHCRPLENNVRAFLACGQSQCHG